MNNSQKITAIEALLKSKTYKELSIRELELINTEFSSMEEYENARVFGKKSDSDLKIDKLPFEIDTKIKFNLMQKMQQRANHIQVKQGSFADIILLFFSPNNLVVKFGIAASLVIGTMFMSTTPGGSGDVFAADTAFVRINAPSLTFSDTSSMLMDTVLYR
ncbi:MAG: hypothetical protein JKY53_09085 [Flavobacteriales bacterium]|nr:hypothetical protein [Flavobacteriales bacterium]